MSIYNQLNSASNVTILAPTNQAFSHTSLNLSDDSVDQALIEYHILADALSTVSTPQFIHSELTNTRYSNVSGGQVVGINVALGTNRPYFLGGLGVQASAATTSPISFTGGYIYPVDNVLPLPASLSATAAAFNLTSWAATLQAAGVATTFDSYADLTVFVPINTAFANVPSINFEVNYELSFIEYHIVHGPPIFYMTGNSNRTLATLQGNNITFDIGSDGSGYVNGAKIIIPNLLIAGGVVHIIDHVLNYNNSGTFPLTSVTPTSILLPSTDSTATSTAGSGSSSSSLSLSSPPSSSTTPATVAGAVVGGIVGLLAILSIAFVLLRRHRRHQSSSQGQSQSQKQNQKQKQKQTHDPSDGAFAAEKPSAAAAAQSESSSSAAPTKTQPQIETRLQEISEIPSSSSARQTVGINEQRSETMTDSGFTNHHRSENSPISQR